MGIEIQDWLLDEDRLLDEDIISKSNHISHRPILRIRPVNSKPPSNSRFRTQFSQRASDRPPSALVLGRATTDPRPINGGVAPQGAPQTPSRPRHSAERIVRRVCMFQMVFAPRKVPFRIGRTLALVRRTACFRPPNGSRTLFEVHGDFEEVFVLCDR